MNNMTAAQKTVLLRLSKKYDPDVWKIAIKGGPEELIIETEDEADELDLFADKIVHLTGYDAPCDQDLYDDATLIANRLSVITGNYRKNKRICLYGSI
jgi:hypothetical protein